ncbi:SagB/ThcOx family dehydrogenase [Parabacteroides sp. 52]|uniref:nitroreductase family protein n=1 Tax=unclassified Parabacteroides TaxID=2649774 RepID=UPI0013D76240|nr:MULTISPECIES: SagB/ThcOx family dehydrogenase [unclassified Parabacteroides]MDH6534653.1 nitroreductase [Parabacteroides sp. PM5-20]NDV56120.1 SagB/ThcOx family dehydrogenase [Parabacteroides sp. 52]
MKRILSIFIALFIVAALEAQELKVIKLNAPNKERGSRVMKAFDQRHSERSYASKPLDPQDLSDLLWAANGINRADGKRTAPSCRDFRDVKVYVILPEGAFLYNAEQHALDPVAAGDHRAIVAGGQAFVTSAPLSLVLVSDLTLFGGTIHEGTKLMASVDVGIVCQNINIACAGLGLATVPRGSMDQAALKEILQLKDTDLLLMNNPVGYPK